MRGVNVEGGAEEGDGYVKGFKAYAAAYGDDVLDLGCRAVVYSSPCGGEC
jgi:hypothetical protein